MTLIATIVDGSSVGGDNNFDVAGTLVLWNVYKSHVE